MKRLALLVTLAAAMAGSVAIANALAGTPSPLDVQTGFGCNVFDANGVLFTTFQSNFTWYGSGKATLHCIGQGAGNGSVVVFDESNTGDQCFFGFDGVPPTDVWNDRVSKSGESQLWCYGFQSPDAPRAAASGVAGVG